MKNMITSIYSKRFENSNGCIIKVVYFNDIPCAILDEHNKTYFIFTKLYDNHVLKGGIDRICEREGLELKQITETMGLMKIEEYKKTYIEIVEEEK